MTKKVWKRFWKVFCRKRILLKSKWSLGGSLWRCSSSVRWVLKIRLKLSGATISSCRTFTVFPFVNDAPWIPHFFSRYRITIKNIGMKLQFSVLQDKKRSISRNGSNIIYGSGSIIFLFTTNIVTQNTKFQSHTFWGIECRFSWRTERDRQRMSTTRWDGWCARITENWARKYEISIPHFLRDWMPLFIPHYMIIQFNQ